MNWTVTISILFSILFPSFHSFEHLEKQLSEKHCHHKYHSAAEITHQHHGFDHCFTCEFAFSTFIATETFAFRAHFEHGAVPYFFASNEHAVSFYKDGNPLRGPPFFIV